MTKNPNDDPITETWRRYLVTGEFEEENKMRRVFRLLPGNPRCKNCYVPFKGSGGRIARAVYGKHPSTLNPKICNICEKFAQEHQGGVEVELSMLFADVRGSTPLAESMSPTEFRALIDRFYRVSTGILVKHDAFIDKLTGDQVTGLFFPGFAGPHHAQQALKAAKEILRQTGHADPDGPWIPLGAGVHTGVAYAGAVGSSGGMVDITVLGDAANTGARLASNAAQGEILVSIEAIASAGIDLDHLESRSLMMKGKSYEVSVRVLTDYA